MNLNDVLIKPIITEKSTLLTEKGKYVFKIEKTANKDLVKKAVKLVFGVDAESVNIVIIRRKTRRTRIGVGYKPSWKKAIVTCKKGDKIELFETK